MLSRRAVRVLLAIGLVAIVSIVAARRAWRPDAPRVSTARVTVGSIETWIATNGIVEPAAPSLVQAPMTTFVQSVPVVEGQRVKRGDLLLTLDVASERTELARAREELAKARAELRLAEAGGPSGERAQVESELQKMEAEISHLRGEHSALSRLVERQAATRDELAQNELALKRAEATRDALATKLKELRQQVTENVDLLRLTVDRLTQTVGVLSAHVRSAELRSAIEGTVYSLPARAGNHVEAGALLAAVADLSRVQVRAFVDGPDLASVREGEVVHVLWSALPNELWMGRIERVPTNVVPRGERRVGEVICSIENSKQQLIPNLDVDVRVRARSRDRALLVPRTAVRTDDTGRYVFVIEDAVVHRKPVMVDVANATSAAIASGLREGETVAVPDQTELREGMRVELASGLP